MLSIGPALPPNSPGKMSALPTSWWRMLQPVASLWKVIPFLAVSLISGFTILKTNWKSLGALKMCERWNQIGTPPCKQKAWSYDYQLLNIYFWKSTYWNKIDPGFYVLQVSCNMFSTHSRKISNHCHTCYLCFWLTG